MLGIGMVLLALVSVQGSARSRLFMLFGIVVGVIVILAVVAPQELSVLPGFGHSHESNYQTSGLYREALLQRALQPGVLGWWGNPVNKVSPAVQFGTATDNQYIILADGWGLIPTFALFAVAATMLVVVGRSHGVEGEPFAILPIIGFTCFVAIFFVAFITQQGAMIWLLIGASGAIAERVASKRREAKIQRRNKLRGWRL
jgi:hypothetical protein